MLVSASCTSRYTTSPRASSRTLQVGVDRHLYADQREPRAPLADTVLERRGDTQVIESHGPQLADETRHHPIDPVDTGDHRTRRLAYPGVAGRRFTDRHRVELDDVQILAEFIVQVARQGFALVLLDVDVLLREPLIFRERLGQPCLRGGAQAKLAICLEVAARGEPDQADRDDQQHAGNLVQLQALVRARPSEQRLTEIELCAEERRGDRDEDDEHDVAAGRDFAARLLAGGHLGGHHAPFAWPGGCRISQG